MSVPPHQVEQLTGSVRASDGVVVVALAGEIDLATVPFFRTLMDQAFAVGVSRVVVDLAEVDFCDAQGLTVLVTAQDRLRAAGGRLSVHSVSPRLYRVFQASGLAEVLHVERPPASSALIGGLLRTAGVPLAREVLDAALKLVVTMAQAVVVGADGVSITLPRHGRFGTVAASNDVVLEMDHDQYDTSEGPCLDAATQGRRFHIKSLSAEDRWPAFVPRARARGIESILSTPLMTADHPIGALNVYSRTVGAFAEHEREWTDQFAAEASVVVSSARGAGSSRLLEDQIGQALLSREVIAMAQGLVVHRDKVSPEVAYAALRDISRRTGQPLADVCEALVRPDVEPGRERPDGSVHGQRTT